MDFKKRETMNYCILQEALYIPFGNLHEFLHDVKNPKPVCGKTKDKNKKNTQPFPGRKDVRMILVGKNGESNDEGV